MIGYPCQTVLVETCLSPGNLCCPLLTFFFPQAFSGWGARGHLLFTPSFYEKLFIYLAAVKLPHQLTKGSQGEFFHWGAPRVLDSETTIFSLSESLQVSKSSTLHPTKMGPPGWPWLEDLSLLERGRSWPPDGNWRQNMQGLVLKTSHHTQRFLEDSLNYCPEKNYPGNSHVWQILWFSKWHLQ